MEAIYPRLRALRQCSCNWRAEYAAGGAESEEVFFRRSGSCWYRCVLCVSGFAARVQKAVAVCAQIKNRWHKRAICPMCSLCDLRLSRFAHPLAEHRLSQSQKVAKFARFSVHKQEKQIWQHAAQQHFGDKRPKSSCREQCADIPRCNTGRSCQQHIERIARKIFADRSTEAMPEQDIRLDPCAGGQCADDGTDEDTDDAKRLGQQDLHGKSDRRLEERLVPVVPV